MVIGALGLIKKGMDKFIQKIPGGIRIQELQKVTLLETTRILRHYPSSRLQPHSNPRPKDG